jgi:penicillin-binding protein 2
MNDLFNPWETSGQIKDGKLGSFYRSRVVDKAPIDPSVPTSYLASALPLRRVRWLGAIMLTGCLLLLARVAYLQVWNGQDYRSKADHNRTQVTSIPASRGIIYDLQGTALVRNEPNFTASVVPTELPDPKQAEYLNTLQTIADALGLQLTEIEPKIAEHAEKYYNQPLVLKEFIPHDEAIDLMSQFKGVPGVHIEAQAARHYLLPEQYAPIIGYLGRISPEDLEAGLSDDYDLSDHIGKTGLEYIYESVLRGRKGTVAKEVTAGGRMLDTIAEEPAIPGGNLVLAIDGQLQQALYDQIKSYADAHHLPGGAAVALDPRTGKVRALVSYPSYDPNVFIQGITSDLYSSLLNDSRKPLFDKAISGEYPSGSTFKLVVASAALQEGVVTPNTTVTSTGGLCINCTGFPDFPDWKAGGHGVTDVYKAIAESVNTYFYLAGGGTYDKDQREITGGLGIDRIDTYAQLFGLGSSSGIDLPGEATGFVPNPSWKEETKGEQWYLGDTYHVSSGQGDLLVTPLQVALYTMIVANGGTVYEPQLVDHVTDQSGVTTDTIDPVVVRDHIVDASNLAVVRAGMRQAVTSGSARSMGSLSVSSAGKTGTAEIGETGKKHSWYTTFLPYDEPKLVVTVLMEEGGDGTVAALPVAKAALSSFSIDSLE